MEGLELLSISRMQRIFFGLILFGTRGLISRLNLYARISGYVGLAVVQVEKHILLHSTRWSTS